MFGATVRNYLSPPHLPNFQSKFFLTIFTQVVSVSLPQKTLKKLEKVRKIRGQSRSACLRKNRTLYSRTGALGVDRKIEREVWF